jgi:hypothetical protein
MNLDRHELLGVFLDATDDLPDDAMKGIDAVIAAINHRDPSLPCGPVQTQEAT